MILNARDADVTIPALTRAADPLEPSMLKTMYVLVVISGQYYPVPVVISQHSSLEKCEHAFKEFSTKIAKNTVTAGVSTTMMRTYTCAETEVLVPKGE